jgi:hypothetical protein
MLVPDITLPLHDPVRLQSVQGGAVMQDYGSAEVIIEKIGVEPTGQKFNSDKSWAGSSPP